MKNLKKKKASAQNTQKGSKKRFSVESDPFFNEDNDLKRRKRFGDDEDIESSDDSEDIYGSDDEGVDRNERRMEKRRRRRRRRQLRRERGWRRHFCIV